MNSDDIRIIKYYRALTKGYGHWIMFSDLRPLEKSKGKRGRKNLIKFIESILGPIDQRWRYQNTSNNVYILQLNDERDLLFFLLKFKQR